MFDTFKTNYFYLPIAVCKQTARINYKKRQFMPTRRGKSRKVGHVTGNLFLPDQYLNSQLFTSREHIARVAIRELFNTRQFFTVRLKYFFILECCILLDFIFLYKTFVFSCFNSYSWRTYIITQKCLVKHQNHSLTPFAF